RSVATADGGGSLIRVPGRTTAYLYSNKNLVGSAGALVGLGLFFIGIVGFPLWPVVVAGLYVAGALATPSSTAIDLHSGWDPGDIRKALQTQMRTINGRVPPDVLAKVSSIQDT